MLKTAKCYHKRLIQARQFCIQQIPALSPALATPEADITRPPERPLSSPGYHENFKIFRKIENKGNVAIALILNALHDGNNYIFMLPTSSLTALTELSNIACSSELSLNSMIFSTPLAPRMQGTPT